MSIVFTARREATPDMKPSKAEGENGSEDHREDYSMFWLISGILMIFVVGMMFGAWLMMKVTHYVQQHERQAKGKKRRLDKQTRSQTSYKWKADTPKFKPLAEAAHGCW